MEILYIICQGSLCHDTNICHDMKVTLQKIFSIIITCTNTQTYSVFLIIKYYIDSDFHLYHITI